MIHKNVRTDFCRKQYMPEIDPTAFIHPLAAVIGHVFINRHVMVSPFASVRGDEGQPLSIGDDSNVQDGVVIHALASEHEGIPVEETLVKVGDRHYAVYIGRKVSLAHQVQIHGPAYVGDATFVGMKSLVFKARVGKNCVIEPGCILMGIRVDDGRYVPAGTVLTEQNKADNLPIISDSYPLKDLNEEVVQVNKGLAEGYNRNDFM